MSSVVQPHSTASHTDLPFILRSALKLAVSETVFIVAIGLVSRYLAGPVEVALLAVLLTVGALAVTFLPGLWVRATEIDGIASAAGIGLTAAGIFVLVDVILLQGNILPFALWTHRWLAIGGGSNWWYHPVWWMVGTFLPWLGAWILANQTAKDGAPSAVAAGALVLVLTLVVGAIASVTHFPGAGWNVGTFGVAFLPALAIATIVTGLGARRK